MKSAVLWDIMPCILADIYQYFGRNCCLHLQGRNFILIIT
jgi:hypothetical protein